MEMERVQMFAAPVKDDLQHGVEVRQGRVAADEQSAPDERTDLAQDDTQLIDTGRFQWLAHRWSVAQCAVSLKVSPRNLALSQKPARLPSAGHTPSTLWSPGRVFVNLLKLISSQGKWGHSPGPPCLLGRPLRARDFGPTRESLPHLLAVLRR